MSERSILKLKKGSPCFNEPNADSLDNVLWFKHILSKDEFDSPYGSLKRRNGCHCIGLTKFNLKNPGLPLSGNE